MEKGRAPKTISNYTIVINRFFGFLRAEGYIEEDPSRRLPNPKVGKRLPRALTVEQVQTLLSAFDKGSSVERRDKVLVYLMYACGLRVNEAVAVRVEDIALEQGTLRVVGKGDRERLLYLKPVVVELLRRYIAETKSQGYLFPGRSGGHITDRNIQMRFKHYSRRAGLPEDVSPHALRHSIAVHYLMERAPLLFVQHLLGHASLATTGSTLSWRIRFICAVATGIGLIPILWGSRRMNCMGVLLLPVALNMVGVGSTVAQRLGLF